MAKYKIVHEKEQCIGCGACAATCPDYFEMEADKSHVKGSKKVGANEELEFEDLKCAKEAGNVCPVNCIHVFENGKKLI